MLLVCQCSAAICYSGGAPRHEDKILSCVAVYFTWNLPHPCRLPWEKVAPWELESTSPKFNCHFLPKAPKQLSALWCTSPSWFSRASFCCCSARSHPQLLQHIHLLEAAPATGWDSGPCSPMASTQCTAKGEARPECNCSYSTCTP